jgi:hypothetical protein
VFGDNTAAQIAQQPPMLTGKATDGYVETMRVGTAH